jgi:preprotein translocase subunit SecF
MQILKHKTNIDFISKRRIALFISSILNLGIIVGIAIAGFNFGVDFAGGTLVEVKFPYSITAEQVRESAKKGGLPEPQVQGIGGSDENSFLLRMGGVTQLTPEGAKTAEQAIRSLSEVTDFRKPDLDNGFLSFRSKTKVEPSAVKAAVEAAGTGVKEVRFLGEENGQFDYQVVSAGMADKVKEALKKGLEKPEFEVRRIDYVGPAVGKQLRNKGIMALIYAMVAILIYVAFRFDLKFGPGALVAMVHDVIMVAGYYLVSRREFNLTSIAVLLTILGYSINDTIVIYDRIREEMARYKGKPLPEIINIAVNDTLSRTLLTSGVTALSLVGLLIFGVGEIFDFAAAMLIGIIVGTYSSVYIASPLTIWLDERQAAKERSGGGSPMKAKAA